MQMSAEKDQRKSARERIGVDLREKKKRFHAYRRRKKRLCESRGEQKNIIE
jgi:hypothetical protein